MKQATVKTKFDEVYTALLLETFVDVNEYAELLQSGVTELTVRLMKSNVSPDRWDHLLGKDDAGGIYAAGYTAATIKGTNPIFEVPSLVDGKLHAITKYILDGETILVNPAGGFCPCVEGYHTILDVTEYVQDYSDSAVIKDDTRYINLENDPELEQHTIDYLSKWDPNFSYIVNLRKFSTDELTDLFIEFKKKGGNTVYVYTTGMDTEQMFEYTDAMIRAYISDVEFEFTTEITDEHKELFDALTIAGVSVTIIGEDDD